MTSQAGRLRPLVGDLRQVAAVRRVVLDDGPERGVRALSFSTGGGLDFWILADRSFDVGPLWWKGVQLGWQGPNGFAAPALRGSDGAGGEGFGRLFGGFLVTCGLSHIRQPAQGHPLHGHLPFTPGRLTAYGEDWERDEPVLFCEGEVVEASLHGVRLVLLRRIEAPVGGTLLRIHDRVENRGDKAVPVSLLYHFNLGHPMAGPGVDLRWGDGAPIAFGMAEGASTIACLPAPRDARCIVEAEGIRATIAFSRETLPWLQLWSDPRRCTNILGIEPVSSERRGDGESPEGALLPPLATRSFDVSVAWSERV